MKVFYAIILSLFSYYAVGQYCPALGPDQTLPCGVGSTILTADVSQCGTGINPKQTTNYLVSNIPYTAQANTGTNLFMTDDSQQGPFQIGFNFCFFGQTYTQFWIGSNGWISFTGGQPTTFTSQPIPTGNALVPKNCIMGPWQDWHPGIGGQIRYQTSGVAPCRKLTVSWIGVPMFQCTGSQGTFHIVIYESSNVIENYIQDKPACIQWQGGTAVQGIHNAAGTIGIAVPGRNSTAWVTNNDAYRWSPSGPTVNPTLTWYQVGNPLPIGTGPSIAVNPPAGGAQYTCQLVYPICNAGWVACNGGSSLGPDTVTVIPGPPIPVVSPITASDTVCFQSNNEIYSVINQPGVWYQWDAIGIITLGQGTDNITIDWSSTQPGFIPGAVMVTPEANGCVGIPVSFDLTILNIVPTIDPIGPFCSYDEFVTLNVTPPNGTLSGIGVIGPDFYPNIAVGTTQVNYVYTLSGCTFDTSITVVVYPQPVLNEIVPGNQFFEICEYDTVPVLYTAAYDLPGTTEWGFNSSTYIGDNFPITWSAPGTYIISAIHYSNGCASSQQDVTVTVAQCPQLLYYIPNSFSPDGNEHNNMWHPIFTDGFDPYNFHVSVYNRWGEIIWESYSPYEGWDGTYNYWACPSGLYNWTLQFGDSENAFQYSLCGSITLIR